MRATTSAPVKSTARQAKCKPMNGRHLSQLGTIAMPDFTGCLGKRTEGRTAEVMIVLMKRSLWLEKNLCPCLGLKCSEWALRAFASGPDKEAHSWGTLSVCRFCPCESRSACAIPRG